MVGLPGSGKTHWLENHKKINADKFYYTLGTNILIDLMEVPGLENIRNYCMRWKSLYQKCHECFVLLLQLASTRKRNYAIDQTNVFPSARKRKLKDFEGFSRKAIVVVPEHSEYLRRCYIAKNEQDKDIPETAVLEMKVNFVLPELEETSSKLFSEVYYAELGAIEALECIKCYNAEASNKGAIRKSSVENFIMRNLVKRYQENDMTPIGISLPKSSVETFQDLEYQISSNNNDDDLITLILKPKTSYVLTIDRID